MDWPLKPTTQLTDIIQLHADGSRRRRGQSFWGSPHRRYRADALKTLQGSQRLVGWPLVFLEAPLLKVPGRLK